MLVFRKRQKFNFMDTPKICFIGIGQMQYGVHMLMHTSGKLNINIQEKSKFHK